MSISLARARPSRRTLDTLPRFIITLLLAIVWALPLAWMFMTSIKPESQVVSLPIRWFPEHLSDLTLQNYINVLTIPRGIDLVRSFLNSLTVATVGTTAVVSYAATQFVVDVWVKSGDDYQLAVRYIGGPAAATKGVNPKL